MGSQSGDWRRGFLIGIRLRLGLSSSRAAKLLKDVLCRGLSHNFEQDDFAEIAEW